MFLGFDCSTQSLSVIAIDFKSKKVMYEKSLNFDEHFPHYHTLHGYLRDAHVRHSPPLMWTEALDKIFAEMVNDRFPLKEVMAISGSAQQHASVYLNKKGVERIKNLDPSLSLVQNLKDGFSRTSSPIWMDSSTSEECAEIRRSLKDLLEVTGSDAYERFTGSQIRKFYKQEPENYAKTAHIALTSSFLASLLSGTLAPIDHADGSGMNLMDIRKKSWWPQALEATAPNLFERLPHLTPSWRVVGQIANYFVKKYGLNKHASITAWSGDNPNSLIGLGVINEKISAVSLGTSFTYFGYSKECHIDPKGESHLFVSPTDDYMPLICFKNGALAIEKVKNFYNLNWKQFNEALTTTQPVANGGIFLPYFESEIVPRAPAGIHRLDLNENDIKANCRALIEGQMISLRIHSEWIKKKPIQIHVTGGVSVDISILQILADVFQCQVFQLPVSKSAALGAALRAVHSIHPKSWEEILNGFTNPSKQIHPNKAVKEIYQALINKYKTYESDCLV